MLIKTTLSEFPYLSRSKVFYDFIKLNFLFRPFPFSSKLDHTTCPDLLLVIEARRYERTSFSLLKHRSQLAIHTAIISIICKAIRRMSRLQDAIIFKLHDLKLAFCNLEFSRLITCHLHQNCTQLLIVTRRF